MKLTRRFVLTSPIQYLLWWIIPRGANAQVNANDEEDAFVHYPRYFDLRKAEVTRGLRPQAYYLAPGRKIKDVIWGIRYNRYAHWTMAPLVTLEIESLRALLNKGYDTDGRKLEMVDYAFALQALRPYGATSLAAEERLYESQQANGGIPFHSNGQNLLSVDATAVYACVTGNVSGQARAVSFLRNIQKQDGWPSSNIDGVNPTSTVLAALACGYNMSDIAAILLRQEAATQLFTLSKEEEVIIHRFYQDMGVNGIVPYPVRPAKSGDVNADNQVNIGDAQQAVYLALHNGEVTVGEAAAASGMTNRTMTITAAVHILRQVLSLA